MEPTKRTVTKSDGSTFEPPFVDGKSYLRQWSNENHEEYDSVIDHQRQQDALAAEESRELESLDDEATQAAMEQLKASTRTAEHR